MKNLQIILFSMALMVLSFNSSGQIMVDQQGQVGIGTWYNTHTDVGGNTRLDISGKTTITVWPAQSGFKFTNCSYNPNHPALINTYWTTHGYIGTSQHKWYRLYSEHVHYNHLWDYSDFKVKENIRPLGDALNKILAIRPIIYDMKPDFYKGADPKDMEKLVSDSKDQIGVIAQEIQKIIPEVVKYNDEEKLFGVSYIDLIPYLIKATQEQQAIIEELKGELKILKDRK